MRKFLDSAISMSELIKIGAAIVITMLLVEIVCWGLFASGLLHDDGRLTSNRVLSGYTLLRTTPNYSFLGYGGGEVRTDGEGFISDTPIDRLRSENTIRIFLLGGSGMMGYAGGTDRIMLYPYAQSIAGFLKTYLSSAVPNVNFEVVNAAAIYNKYYQSFLLYVSKISAYEPSFIVNMDGFNDSADIIAEGDLYESNEAYWLPRLVEIERINAPAFYKNSYAYKAFQKAFIKAVNAAKTRNFSSLSLLNPALAADSARPAEYLARLGRYKLRAQRFLQVHRQYDAALQADGMHFIFALQPTLWKSVNKPLSVAETKMAASDFGFEAAWKESASYFFDDYVGSELEKITLRYGGDYIDIGRSIQDIPSDVGFYIDPAHYTPEGNKIIAEILGRGIVARLARSQPGTGTQAGALPENAPVEPLWTLRVEGDRNWTAGNAAVKFAPGSDGLALETNASRYDYQLLSQDIATSRDQRYSVAWDVEVLAGKIGIGVLDTREDKWIVNKGIPGARGRIEFIGTGSPVRVVVFNNNADPNVQSKALIRSLHMTPH